MLIEEKPRLFDEAFPYGITMVLKRLEPWEWSAVQHAAQRDAATLREGKAAVEEYGFQAEEFQVLADPASWDGVATFLYAVRLAMTAIESWKNVRQAGEDGDLPIDMRSVSRLLRLEQVRLHFLDVMNREGQRYFAQVEEGNA